MNEKARGKAGTHPQGWVGARGKIPQFKTQNLKLKTEVGMFYGVGIGPGDPELITLKAIKVLDAVKVIAVPQSKAEGESLALDIVRQVVDIKDKEILELTFPMKKEHDELTPAWNEAKKKVVNRLENGKSVAFITIGDPLFYSTFIYILEKVKNQKSKVKIKVIPGVSSINAASALICTPLAKGSERLAVLPATYEDDTIRQTLKEFDTVVLMKVNKVMDRIIAILEEMNLKKKVVFISNAGLPNQEIIKDLNLLKGRKLNYFSLLLVKRPSQKLPCI